MATKLPSGKYRTLVYVGTDSNGKRMYESFIADSEDEADFMALQFKLNKNRKSKVENLTLEEAMEKYISSRDNILSPSTISGYNCIKKLRLKSLMNQKISDISQINLQRAINEESKKGLSHKTIKEAYNLFSSVMREYNPDIKYKVTLPQPDVIEYTTPDPKTLSKILSITYGTPLEIPVLLSSWLSLSASEICGLRMSDIEEEYVNIRQSKIYANGKQHIKKTKTVSRTRKIPLPEYIKNRIKETCSGEYVTILTGQAIGKRLTRILQKNNLPHVRFHDLRHANASIMAMLNIPTNYAMARGGWSSDKIMKKVYTQTFSSEELAVAKRIDGLFSELLQHDMQHEENESVDK